MVDCDLNRINDFHIRLQKLIDCIGLPIREIADKIGSDDSTIRDSWLKRKKFPPADKLIALISLSGGAHTANWLLTGKEDAAKSCPVQCDEEMIKLCSMVKNVIKSKTEYSGALNENIHAFDLAVDERKKSEKERLIMQNEINNLRSTVFDVLKKLEYIEKQKNLKPNTDTD